MNYQYGRIALRDASSEGHLSEMELALNAAAYIDAAVEVCWSLKFCGAVLSLVVACVWRMLLCGRCGDVTSMERQHFGKRR
jgi:hypothetical protein